MLAPYRRTMAFLMFLVVCAGLGIGALLALGAKELRHTSSATVVAIASPTAGRAAATTAPTHAATQAPTHAPTAAPTVTTTSTPTTAPTQAPSAAPTAAFSASPKPIQPAAAGMWRIAEANVRVGTIVWTGASNVNGSRMTLQLHKESVAGRSAAPCERATTLVLTVETDAPEQDVPYREVNCAGTTSSGTVHVGSVDSTSFAGSFWDGSSKLGDFNANRI